MDMLVVRGGTRLNGEVAVSGAKNAALPIMAAALASSGSLRLRNVPELVDVRTQIAVLEQLGVTTVLRPDATLVLQVVDHQPCVAPYELVRRMRASVCVLGPLLARRGRACVSLPGGCNIGFRPIDLHLKGLAALGAEIKIDQGYVIATAKRLRGARIDLSGPFGTTVTGTCNVMTAATLARGTTIIESAACEPEVVDLAECLNRMGARIEGAGSSQLIICGVDELGGAEHEVLPDRIEAATLLCAGVITGGDVRLAGARQEHLQSVLDHLQQVGAQVECQANHLRVCGSSRLRPLKCDAVPYPGLPTDVQAQLTALLTQADGVSQVSDHVFPDRFLHLPELCRLGADIRRDGATALIRGTTRLAGTNVMASDLRASAALVLAALAADGESVIRRIYHLDRGYERLERKLALLGGDIHRVRDYPAEIPGFPSWPVDEPTAESKVPTPHFPSARTFHRVSPTIPPGTAGDWDG
ncbi:MAG: UDP-N-acetylglucosamine 1-carboxyvinyltransferase [Planctomycetaceae bacterium]